jgi:hypothetical protein
VYKCSVEGGCIHGRDEQDGMVSAGGGEFPEARDGRFTRILLWNELVIGYGVKKEE